MAGLKGTARQTHHNPQASSDDIRVPVYTFARALQEEGRAAGGRGGGCEWCCTNSRFGTPGQQERESQKPARHEVWRREGWELGKKPGLGCCPSHLCVLRDGVRVRFPREVGAAEGHGPPAGIIRTPTAQLPQRSTGVWASSPSTTHTPAPHTPGGDTALMAFPEAAGPMF